VEDTFVERLVNYFGSSLTNFVEGFSALLNIFLVLNETFERQLLEDS
jgi:hypothetical protein